jgi:hypothetical protein
LNIVIFINLVPDNDTPILNNNVPKARIIERSVFENIQSVPRGKTTYAKSPEKVKEKKDKDCQIY